MLDPTIFFTEVNLDAYFRKKLRSKKGGGIDNLSPKKFYDLYKDQFGEIAKKCLDGTYNFSCYREKPVVKAANKYPRVLSIPSMRDRLVLGVLNEYLQAVYDSKGYKQLIPNNEIRRLISYLDSVPKDAEIRFLKTDFHNYYGTIDRGVLLSKLSPDVDPRVLSLIEKAISMPTIPHGVKSSLAKPKKYGIPQGLSISNILAYVYLKDFDDNYGSWWAEFYSRYVDDILFLNPKYPFLLKKMKRNLSTSKMRIKFNDSKVVEGVIGKNALDFIGYCILDNHTISIRKKNVAKFITRIAGLTKRCAECIEDATMRPKFCKDDDVCLKYFIEEFNLMLAGFKISAHNYGWMAYYQAINDVSLVYGMERVIEKRIMAKLPTEIKDKLVSLVDVYHDIRDTGGKKVLLNFDKIETIKEKRAYLYSKGYDLEDKDDSKVEKIYDRYLANLIRQTELSIGRIS